MRQTFAMPKILEVIVTSVEDAIEAEAGGADRLELVRAFEIGGLTPDAELVRAVLGAVQIPVRTMLRESPSMSAGDGDALRELQRKAEGFAQLPMEGLVAGFVESGRIDLGAMKAVFSSAPRLKATFHRAFDEIAEPTAGVEQLKELPQIDRILTAGGEGNWTDRRRRLLEWQRAAAPRIKLLVGVGLSSEVMAELSEVPTLTEIHVGRAARVPPTVAGSVKREAVRRLKSIFL